MRQPVTPTVSAGKYHNVRRGETLWRIARMHSVSVDALVEANGITNPRQVETGRRLLIPEIKEFDNIERSSAASRDFAWPVRGSIVSAFGNVRNRVNNKGIDIQVNSASNVSASRGGVVTFVGRDLHGWGNSLIIDHGDGFETVYAGLSRINAGAGDRVASGDTIGLINASGGAHALLHFEVRKGHIPKDPLYYLP